MSPESDAETTPQPLLQIVGLHASVDGQPILRGIDLTVGSGQVHAIMGPNGSGKSTLANVLLGNPAYEVTAGSILFHGEDITSWATDVRGKAGIFLAFQDPEAIGGVPVIQFLRQALSARRGMDMSVLEVRLMMMAILDETDSGLDVDALRTVARGVHTVREARPELGVLVISHYQRMLDELDADRIHLLVDGVIVEEGGPELGARLEAEGYDAWRN